MKYVYLLLLLVLLLFSCKRKCTFLCDHPNFGIVMTGFSEEEIDTVEVRRYAANGKFDDLLSYTLIYDVYYHGLGRFEPYTDWEFYVPATKKTYRFSEIKDEGKTSVSADCKKTTGCINSTASYKLNGQVINQSHGEIVK